MRLHHQPFSQSNQHGLRALCCIRQVGTSWVKPELQAVATGHEIADRLIAASKSLLMDENLVTHHLCPAQNRAMQQDALANGCMHAAAQSEACGGPCKIKLRPAKTTFPFGVPESPICEIVH